VLAYLFWHRPREGADADRYEQAQLSFHRSLAHNPPAGLRGSAIYRIPGVPWAEHGQPKPSFEDWYLLDDFAAMGVLGEAAVGRGHRTAHEAAASAFGTGAGGLYGLLEGEPTSNCLGRATLAVWVARPPGSAKGRAAELLGDGMDPSSAGLWRRQFVLGPGPEFCVLGSEAPAGVSPERLPAGWTARSIEREVLFAS
jgi:hypothetical protein